MGYDNELQNEREGWHDNEPPAPRAGERDTWKLGNLAIHGYKIYNEQGREIVTNIYRREDAEQIITEHNQHATLVAQRDRLLEALKSTAHNAADGSGLCWDLADDRVHGHHLRCTRLRELITTIEQSVGSVGESEGGLR